ncbi:TPR-like protein, partial [Gloeophyllum trabeum ATCC 11539]
MTSRKRRATALDPSRSVWSTSPRPSPRHHRKNKGSISRQHPLANDTTDGFQDNQNGEEDDDEEDEGWGMVDRMRLWRHDAMMQHLYDTAIFWGDKVLSWTEDPNDAFWLAQVYFMGDQFSRAETLLTRPFPVRPDEGGAHGRPAMGNHPYPLQDFNTPYPHPFHASAANLKGKGKEKEHMGPVVPGRLPAGMIDVTAQGRSNVSRLVDMSVACRYLAAQCQVEQGKWQAAIEMLGESNPFKSAGTLLPALSFVEASMCYLRGVLMQKHNRHEKAKHCFMEALTLDVKCYEALNRLAASQMMTPDEEWEFVQALPYQEQAQEDAEFVRLMYLSRLRKYKHAEEQTTVLRRLSQEYALTDNPDVLFAFADQAYAQFRWADCFAITSRILDLTSIHEPTMPLHIACMYHLRYLRSKLFVLAHDLVRKEPENAISWYAVGVWYLSSSQYKDARQYFGKASLMDPRFSPAWIAFGHSYALEGEHDAAITAYSTCARLYPGSHLPLTFAGMEYLTLAHQLAAETLNAAYDICDSDPLTLNERGIVMFNLGNYEEAVTLFSRAIELAGGTQSAQETWLSTYINLGTSYRKLKRYEEASTAYENAIRVDSRSAAAFSFLGLTQHLLGDMDQAIVRYHEALSIDPMNPFVLELLNMALE